MRLAMVGATGRTGSRLLEVALERGHTVRALRRGAPGEAVPDALTWIQGDVLDPSAVAQLASGAEAMVVLLGPRFDSPPDLCRRGMATVISACRAFRIRRLVVLSCAMVGHPRDRLAMLLRTMWRTYRVVRPTLAADREAQERGVVESGLDWTLIRPPRLIEGDRTEGVVAGSELFVPARGQATIGDVIDVMIDAIERDMWIRSGVTVLSDAEAATEPDLAEGPFGDLGSDVREVPTPEGPIPVEVEWDLDSDEVDEDPTLGDARATRDASPPAPADGPPDAAVHPDEGDWDLAPDLDSDERSAGGSG